MKPAAPVTSTFKASPEAKRSNIAYGKPAMLPYNCLTGA
jgi:hypothetical protein